eukprot:Em0001g3073a
MATSIGSVGTVEPFNRDTDNWTYYCERLEQYFVANGISDDAKQRAVLLTGCGGDTYQLIRSLVFPAKPTERTFSEIVELDSESVSQFVAELRKLSEFCEFGDTLDVMLRDRLVGRLQQLWKTRAHCSGMPTESGGTEGTDIRHQGGQADRRVPAKSKGKTKQDSPEPLPTDTLYCFRSPDPLKAPVKINNVTIVMEVDTGAAASVISERTYKNSWVGVPRPPLLSTDVLLRTYSGERLDIRGEIKVDVQFRGKEAKLNLLVVGGKGPSLMGRDWISVLHPNLVVLNFSMDGSLKSLLDKHAALFKEELGQIKGVKVKIHVDPKARPSFFKPRQVPYALRARLEEELKRLETAGIIEPVSHSDWAAPVVPVVKGDGIIRLCGDYKVTINRVASLEKYPLPRIEDLISSLGKGKVFTKLDLANAYLQGIPDVLVYLDDILVAGSSEAEHMQLLEIVLAKLENAGHHISAERIRPADDKKRAVLDAPVPQNIPQLRSFLGLVNFYGKFLHNLADTLAPLHQLLRKNERWHWGQQQGKAFEKAKSQLTSPCVLTHFDPDKRLVLSCDASPYGLGAVLAHQFEDGSERPVAFASRSLAPAERKYSQIEKEGLAIVYGVKRFHQFLVGRHFMVYSDHKPLQYLFSESRPVPAMASARIQRWALTLSAYNYHIVYRSAKEQSNADGLSRLPVEEAPKETFLPGEMVLTLGAFLDEGCPVTVSSIRAWTAKDPILARVKGLILGGWPAGDIKLSGELRIYQQRAMELSVQDGCVMWGSRVVIPPVGCAHVLQLLHEGHPGITRMKALARGVVWWPGIDSELESKVKVCEACQANRKSPPKAPLHPWEWPSKPWSRLHIDHAGPFMGKIFLIMVDSYSKWLEVVPVASTSSQQTIKELRHMFATHGLPEIVVSDNGTAFSSTEFGHFMKHNGIRHIGVPLITHLVMGQPPAQLLMGRRPRTLLDLMVPDITSQVHRSQERQKTTHDHGVKPRSFMVGDVVYVKNFRVPPKWIPGVIIAQTGPLLYAVRLDTGVEVKRHVDHVRFQEHGLPLEEKESGIEGDGTDAALPAPINQEDTASEIEPDPLAEQERNDERPGEADEQEMDDEGAEDADEVQEAKVEQREVRRSNRQRHPPDRYRDYVWELKGRSVVMTSLPEWAWALKAAKCLSVRAGHITNEHQLGWSRLL